MKFIHLSICLLHEGPREMLLTADNGSSANARPPLVIVRASFNAHLVDIFPPVHHNTRDAR
jgi:hypothetical protein